MVTGNVRARYRLIFEPFWFIYLFGLLDTVVLLFQNGLNRERHIGGSGRPKEQGRPLPSGKCAKPPKVSVMSHSRLLAANNTEPNPLNALLFALPSGLGTIGSFHLRHALALGLSRGGCGLTPVA